MEAKYNFYWNSKQIKNPRAGMLQTSATIQGKSEREKGKVMPLKLVWKSGTW